MRSCGHTEEAEYVSMRDEDVEVHVAIVGPLSLSVFLLAKILLPIHKSLF